jgi:hypothetical protein
MATLFTVLFFIALAVFLVWAFSMQFKESVPIKKKCSKDPTKFCTVETTYGFHGGASMRGILAVVK